MSDEENYNGNYVPFVPKHTFNAGAQYVFGLRNGAIFDNITVNANYKAAGRIYWTEQNNASQALWHTQRTCKFPTKATDSWLSG